MQVVDSFSSLSSNPNNRHTMDPPNDGPGNRDPADAAAEADQERHLLALLETARMYRTQKEREKVLAAEYESVRAGLQKATVTISPAVGFDGQKGVRAEVTGRIRTNAEPAERHVMVVVDTTDPTKLHEIRAAVATEFASKAGSKLYFSAHNCSELNVWSAQPVPFDPQGVVGVGTHVIELLGASSEFNGEYTSADATANGRPVYIQTTTSPTDKPMILFCNRDGKWVVGPYERLQDNGGLEAHGLYCTEEDLPVPSKSTLGKWSIPTVECVEKKCTGARAFEILGRVHTDSGSAYGPLTAAEFSSRFDDLATATNPKYTPAAPADEVVSTAVPPMNPPFDPVSPSLPMCHFLFGFAEGLDPSKEHHLTVVYIPTSQSPGPDPLWVLNVQARISELATRRVFARVCVAATAGTSGMCTNKLSTLSFDPLGCKVVEWGATNAVFNHEDTTTQHGQTNKLDIKRPASIGKKRVPKGLAKAEFTSSAIGGMIRRSLNEVDQNAYSNSLAQLFVSADQSDGIETFTTASPDMELDMTELTHRLHKTQLAEVLKSYNVLTHFDLDGDGDLTVEEILTEIDINKDQKISFAEFINAFGGDARMIDASSGVHMLPCGAKRITREMAPANDGAGRPIPVWKQKLVQRRLDAEYRTAVSCEATGTEMSTTETVVIMAPDSDKTIRSAIRAIAVDVHTTGSYLQFVVDAGPNAHVHVTAKVTAQESDFDGFETEVVKSFRGAATLIDCEAPDALVPADIKLRWESFRPVPSLWGIEDIDTEDRVRAELCVLFECVLPQQAAPPTKIVLTPVNGTLSRSVCENLMASLAGWFFDASKEAEILAKCVLDEHGDVDVVATFAGAGVVDLEKFMTRFGGSTASLSEQRMQELRGLAARRRRSSFGDATALEMLCRNEELFNIFCAADIEDGAVLTPETASSDGALHSLKELAWRVDRKRLTLVLRGPETRVSVTRVKQALRRVAPKQTDVLPATTFLELVVAEAEGLRSMGPITFGFKEVGDDGLVVERAPLSELKDEVPHSRTTVNVVKPSAEHDILFHCDEFVARVHRWCTRWGDGIGHTLIKDVKLALEGWDKWSALGADLFNVDTSSKDGVERDSHNNLVGSEHDLGKDGAYEGLTIVVLQLYSGAELTFAEPQTALEKKGFTVNRVVGKAPPPAELDTMLSEANQLWVISAATLSMTDPQHAVIIEHWRKGMSMYIFGDNEPYFEDANRILKSAGLPQMSGNFPAQQMLSEWNGIEGAPGGFTRGHFTHGITTLNEGSTIAEFDKDEVEAAECEVVMRNSQGNFSVTYKPPVGRNGAVISDGAFTKLFPDLWREGSPRFVSNCACLLAAHGRKASRPPVHVELTQNEDTHRFEAARIARTRRDANAKYRAAKALLISHTAVTVEKAVWEACSKTAETNFGEIVSDFEALADKATTFIKVYLEANRNDGESDIVMSMSDPLFSKVFSGLDRGSYHKLLAHAVTADKKDVFTVLMSFFQARHIYALAEEWHVWAKKPDNWVLQSVAEAPPILIDIAFLIDGSGSVQPEGWESSISFVDTVVKGLVGSGEVGSVVRIALITFSSETRIDLSFKECTDEATVTAKVNWLKTNFPSCSTQTAKAFEVVEKDIFKGSTRETTENHHKILIVLTDGYPDESSPDPAPIAQRIREDLNVEIIAVGVGDNIDEPFLKKLAGSKGVVHTSKDFKILASQMSVTITDEVLTKLPPEIEPGRAESCSELLHEIVHYTPPLPPYGWVREEWQKQYSARLTDTQQVRQETEPTAEGFDFKVGTKQTPQEWLENTTSIPRSLTEHHEVEKAKREDKIREDAHKEWMQTREAEIAQAQDTIRIQKKAAEMDALRRAAEHAEERQRNTEAAAEQARLKSEVAEKKALRRDAERAEERLRNDLQQKSQEQFSGFGDDGDGFAVHRRVSEARRSFSTDRGLQWTVSPKAASAKSLRPRSFSSPPKGALESLTTELEPQVFDEDVDPDSLGYSELKVRMSALGKKGDAMTVAQMRQVLRDNAPKREIPSGSADAAPGSGDATATTGSTSVVTGPRRGSGSTPSKSEPESWGFDEDVDYDTLGYGELKKRMAARGIRQRASSVPVMRQLLKDDAAQRGTTEEPGDGAHAKAKKKKGSLFAMRRRKSSGSHIIVDEITVVQTLEPPSSSEFTSCTAGQTEMVVRKFPDGSVLVVRQGTTFLLQAEAFQGPVGGVLDEDNHLDFNIEMFSQ
eukprot:m.327697 g.327697  ORF g.327697 m.327697 type:complete len:2219 (-) comp27683_c0_seq15:207-6863(-)